MTNQEMGLQRSGDCDNNNRVDSVDFIILRNSFGRSSGQQDYDRRADVTGDGMVNASRRGVCLVRGGGTAQAGKLLVAAAPPPPTVQESLQKMQKSLERIGWRIVHAQEVASTPWDYQHFVQSSRGEFSCVTSWSRCKESCRPVVARNPAV